MTAIRGRGRAAALLFLAVLMPSCSSGEEAPPTGQSAVDVCDGFAGEPVAAKALESIVGNGVRVTSDTADPEKVITDLRRAAQTPQSGKRWMDGVPFCGLEQAKDGRGILDITFREALSLPREDDKVNTSYSSGLRATSSDLFAAVYFACDMKEPAHEIVVVAELQRALDHEADHQGIRDDQITVTNAAARRVAKELGCANPRLADGVPAKKQS
jgi:hypothetical protein